MSLAALLSSNGNLTLTANNRVKCSITNHEMTANFTAVQQYLQSKALKKAREWYSMDFSKYLPYIVEHKRDAKKLFCRLTKIKLNKIPKEVERHCNGKKFNRLKKEYEDAKKSKRKKSEADEETDIAHLEDLFHENSDDGDGDDGASDDAPSDEEMEEEGGEDDLADLYGSDHEDEKEVVQVPRVPVQTKKGEKSSTATPRNVERAANIEKVSVDAKGVDARSSTTKRKAVPLESDSAKKRTTRQTSLRQ